MEINILREVSNEQLNLHFKELWEEDQPKYIVYRRKEITEEDINKIRNRKTTNKTNVISS